jgi:hypothetical protein
LAVSVGGGGLGNEARALPLISEAGAQITGPAAPLWLNDRETPAGGAALLVGVLNAEALPTPLKKIEKNFSMRVPELGSEDKRLPPWTLIVNVPLLFFAVTYYNVFLRPA